MRRCPRCSRQTDVDGRFCPFCGADATAGADLTRTSANSGAVGSRDSRVEKDAAERFLPGSLLAGRYRIVGPLGRGGMGDVYRADDVKLGQAVALKFLPAALERDPSRLARLLKEVRIARQISHPNVCRVYDVGEVDGRHFLSMEYVDGEDLASLLRRIGRLPGDKAGELARQLCAGLSAAHEQGILHRDLKPANVMIDGRGRARITDFGLAAAAGEVRGDEVRVGTPAYMAPEQRAGTSVSVRSDLYSLGLVLYEMFTGKEAFRASSPAELDELQRSGTPTNPSTLVENLNPAVERVILRCLAADPADRPASALAVAAALPGGDPLAAALAAGETPSPEMVAAAGGEGALSPRAAAVWLALALTGIAVYGVLYTKASLVAFAPVDKPAEVLAERAREIARNLGYEEPAADRAFRFIRNPDVLRWVSANDAGAERFRSLREHRPAGVMFWYRESPRQLVPWAPSGEVDYLDPPPFVTGMRWVQTDPRGRLIGFLAAPPQLEESHGPAAEPDWAVVFREAGLDAASFAPADPAWVPLLFGDTRRAWTGELSECPGVPVRVEAASYRGRVSYLTIAGPWSRPGRQTQFRISTAERLGNFLLWMFRVVAVLIALVLARRHLRSGRGDRRGALRLALYLASGQILLWLVSADHVAGFEGEWILVERALATALYASGLVWVLYIALEPFVRRWWPESIIGWTRLLSGRFRDPLVGRELLIGAAVGAVLAVVNLGYDVLALASGTPGATPTASYVEALVGPGSALATLLEAHLWSLNFAMFLFFFQFAMIAWTKARWPGIAAFALVSSVMAFLLYSPGPIGLKVGAALLWGILVTAFYQRAGLLGAVLGLLVGNSTQPLFFDPSAWYAGRTWTAWLVIVVLILYGFRIALGGRPERGQQP